MHDIYSLGDWLKQAAELSEQYTFPGNHKSLSLSLHTKLLQEKVF